MTKEQLVGALCTAQDIEIPVHRRGPALDRKAVKTKIQELKAKRQAAVESKDSTQLARARRRIQRLKRKLRAATI
jgi:protein-arginine kinase activator protein McsA